MSALQILNLGESLTATLTYSREEMSWYDPSCADGYCEDGRRGSGHQLLVRNVKETALVGSYEFFIATNVLARGDQF